MSRKTKEEKKLANLRKQKILLQQISSTKILHKEITHAPIKQIEIESKEVKLPDLVELKPEDLSRRNYFVRDLKKSLIIIVGIITLEILVYFATINRY